jgi:hypothetical protein
MSEPAGRPGLMSVRTEVVQEVLIPGLLDAALEREKGELPEAVDSALDAASDALESRVPAVLAARLARIGYLGRGIELERFAPARQSMPWLTRALAVRDAAAVSAELAAEEPLEKPRPEDRRAVTWRVPGPGGHVRHLVAMRAAARALDEAGGSSRLPDGTDSARELKRFWVYGFLLRCCEE